jgi:sugar phosphate isomerase/epimerase
MYSRRTFGKLALAAVPLTKALARVDSKVAGVQLGAQSYSFRDLPFDAALKAMAEDGLGVCELFGPHIEMGGAVAPMGHRVSPEEATKWRTTVPMSYFKGVRKKFNDAGVKLIGYNYSFNAKWSDREIERGFEMADALGVSILTASTTLPVAERVAPFADKHKITVAMHGHSDVKDPNQFSTPETFERAMKMSKHYKINLDIGHFTAAGFDPVDYIRKNHENIVILHLKDRKKDQGPNTVWGEGDTPIKPVLQLLKDNKYPIPALIEYEYKGSGTSVEEVKKCFEYAKQALQS